MKIVKLSILVVSFNMLSHYQDIVINNMILAHGSFECEPRYKVIKKFLKTCKSDFVLCDLGASEGYFSFRVASRFPESTCIMIEGNYSPQSADIIADRLEALHEENTDIKNVIYWKKYFDCQELKKLSESNHFDVVLALNFVHHFGSNWEKALEAICNMADYVILQTPSEYNINAGSYDTLNAIHEFVKARNGQTIGRFPTNNPIKMQDTMYVMKTKK